MSHVRLLELIVLWTDAAGNFDSRPYNRLGLLWLATPAEAGRPGVWHVRTVQGEDLVLSSTPPFTGRLSQELNAFWQGQPLHIPSAEVVSVFQVSAP